MPGPPAEPRARSLWLPLALTLLALALRLPGISASFYGDEGFSLLRDSTEWLTPTEDRFRPLFFSLLHGWRLLGFHGEVGLRLLPLLFGVATVPVAFALGLRLAGLRAGSVFALLIAVSPLLIEFSQELRMYSLVPLLAVTQAWFFCGAAERAAAGKPALAQWLGFVLAGAAGVYTHFHYWFLIAGFGVAALRRRRELPLRQSIVAMAALVALYLPNVPNVLRFQREAADQPHLLATDLPSALPKLIAACSVGFNYFVLPDLGIERAVRLSTLAPNALLAALAAIPAVAIAWALVRLSLRRVSAPDASRVLWLGHELFTVPVLLAFLAVMATGKNFIHPKYMVFSAPFLPLIFTAGYLALERVWLERVVTVSALLVSAVALVHFNQPERYGRREDWRGVTATLRAELGDGATALLLSNANAPARPVRSSVPASLLEYYGGDLFERMQYVRNPGSASVEAEAAELLRLTAGKRDVFYIWTEIARNFDDPQDRVLGAARSVFAHEQARRFNPRVVLYHWRTK